MRSEMRMAISTGQSFSDGVSILPLTGIRPEAISHIVTPSCKENLMFILRTQSFLTFWLTWCLSLSQLDIDLWFDLTMRISQKPVCNHWMKQSWTKVPFGTYLLMCHQNTIICVHWSIAWGLVLFQRSFPTVTHNTIWKSTRNCLGSIQHPLGFF